MSHTWAYARLYAELLDLARAHVPAAGRALLAPSSTGEVLRWVGDTAAVWWCIDIDPACLRCCSRLAPRVETALADLDHEWPLPADGGFDLVLSIHALHFLDRPEWLLRRVATALSPSGVALWVVFAAGASTPGAVLADLLSVGAAGGLAEAVNFAPWAAADALMLRAARRAVPAWTRRDLAAFFAANGHTVLACFPTFNARSQLLVTRAQHPREEAP